MWDGMDKIRQRFLKIAGLLLFLIFIVIIILSTGSSKDYQPDISASVAILFVLLVVVTSMIIINRIPVFGSMDQEKGLTKNRKHSRSSIRTGMKD